MSAPIPESVIRKTSERIQLRYGVDSRYADTLAVEALETIEDQGGNIQHWPNVESAIDSVVKDWIESGTWR